MTTPNFICPSINTVLKIQNHCAQTYSVFAGFLAGLAFLVQWTSRLQVSMCWGFFSVNTIIVHIHMSQGYMLSSIKHCIAHIILLAADDLNLRGQMTLKKQWCSVVCK